MPPLHLQLRTISPDERGSWLTQGHAQGSIDDPAHHVVVHSSRRSIIEMHSREGDIFARDIFLFKRALLILLVKVNARCMRDVLIPRAVLIQYRDCHRLIKRCNANIYTIHSFLWLRSNRWLSYYSVTNAGLLTAHVIRYTYIHRVMPQYRILSEESERYYY